jgi:hypothetical protein
LGEVLLFALFPIDEAKKLQAVNYKLLSLFVIICPLLKERVG